MIYCKLAYLPLFLFLTSHTYASETVLWRFEGDKNIEIRYDDDQSWFVSFTNFDEEIEKLKKTRRLEKNVKIEGKFMHENFSGPSYRTELSKEALNTLNETKKKKNLYSIWDYLNCQRIYFNIIETTKGTMKFKIDQVRDCSSIWDD
ncbi:MAG: hypothetical protein CMP11_05945 [Zetaproteobacteria bacterium]|nr:hypothetical protein [Pseudobdellovibrionaceae bacterium]|tara:strand:- start:3362 stop:3802 length:441 start_codon:yes stop_codon:yes gene_type:complete